MSVDVLDDNGNSFGEFQAPCTSFATTIPLPPGTYSASAELVDDANNPRTTTIHVAPFDIVSGTALTVPVDFPASSFN